MFSVKFYLSFTSFSFFLLLKYLLENEKKNFCVVCITDILMKLINLKKEQCVYLIGRRTKRIDLVFLNAYVGLIFYEKFY